MKMCRSIAAVLLMNLICAAACGTAGPVLQGFGGAALNLPTTLTISQSGYEDLNHSAEWSTRPFQQPFYWAVRLGWRRAADGFELQLLHHKLFVENPTGEIEHFEVTHGFNILTGHWVGLAGPAQLRLGAGVVLPSTESTVRGKYRGTASYRISGPALLAGVGHEVPLVGGFFVAAEAQIIVAWATVDVADGQARVRSLALHLLMGAGWAF